MPALINGHTPEDLAAMWGSDSAGDKGRFTGDGALFYNFGSEIQPKDHDYLSRFIGAIERTLNSAKASGAHDPEDITELEELRDHVASLFKLDAFTRAYIRTALWSSTGPAFDTCPCCGKDALLTHYPEEEYDQVPMCSAPGCGVTEIDNFEPLDDCYSHADLAPSALAETISDCKDFQKAQHDVIQAAIDTGKVKCGPDFVEWERAGHDFWLTRCGHGAGFWDGDWPEPFASQLTEAAKVYGNVDLMPGDDGKLYV